MLYFKVISRTRPLRRVSVNSVWCNKYLKAIEVRNIHWWMAHTSAIQGHENYAVAWCIALHFDETKLYHCICPRRRQSRGECFHRCLFFQTISQQVSAAADRPARRSASRPPCCTQNDVDSQCDKLWPMKVTSLPHWPSTWVDSTWDDQPF